MMISVRMMNSEPEMAKMMNIVIKKITVLLSVLTAFATLHAQENPVDTLQKSACIPVRTVAEEELAYQAGERLHFTLPCSVWQDCCLTFNIQGLYKR